MSAVANLVEKLDEVLLELVEAKAKGFDFDDTIKDAAENYDFDSFIEKAVENYNFDEAINTAVGEFDFTESIEKNVDLESEAEQAVTDALREADLERKAAEAVDKVLDEVLPGRVEEVLFKLLQRPEVAERLVRVLFDRASE